MLVPCYQYSLYNRLVKKKKTTPVGLFQQSYNTPGYRTRQAISRSPTMKAIPAHGPFGTGLFRGVFLKQP